MDSIMRSSVKNVTNFMSNAPDNLIDGIQKASDKVQDVLKFTDFIPTTSNSNSQDDSEDFSAFNDRIDVSIADQPFITCKVYVDEAG